MTHIGMFIAGIALATGVLAQGPTNPTADSDLQGTWLVTSLNGQSAPGGVPPVTLTITGNAYHQTVGSDVIERGTIKVDASKKPMAVDFVITEGQDAGKTQLSVVEVSGNTMRASLGAPGAGQRPGDFTVRDGGIVLVATKATP